MDCRRFGELVHAYLDGELAGGEAAEVESHLELCADCFRSSQLEEGFRRIIRERAPSPAAPALERRVLEAIAAEHERVAVRADGRPAGPRAGATRRAWTARALAAAAVVLLAVVGLRLTGGGPWGTGGAGPGDPAFVRGRLICLDCLMAAEERSSEPLATHLPRPRVPSDDPSQHHALRLRSTAGRLWTLFPEEAAAATIADHDNVGREATVVGTAYPELGVIRTARLTLH